MLRRFTKNDWMAFQGAEPMPSGSPLIGDAHLPYPDGSSKVEIIGTVVVCGCTDLGVFAVGIHFTTEDESVHFRGLEFLPHHSFNIMWDFPCERDAVAFGEMLASGRMSLNALEQLGGELNEC